MLGVAEEINVGRKSIMKAAAAQAHPTVRLSLLSSLSVFSIFLCCNFLPSAFRFENIFLFCFERGKLCVDLKFLGFRMSFKGVDGLWWMEFISEL